MTKTSSHYSRERSFSPAIPVFLFYFFSVTDSYYHFWKNIKEDEMKRQLEFPNVQSTCEQSNPKGSFPCILHPLFCSRRGKLSPVSDYGAESTCVCTLVTLQTRASMSSFTIVTLQIRFLLFSFRAI